MFTRDAERGVKRELNAWVNELLSGVARLIASNNHVAMMGRSTGVGPAYVLCGFRGVFSKR